MSTQLTEATEQTQEQRIAELEKLNAELIASNNAKSAIQIYVNETTTDIHFSLSKANKKLVLAKKDKIAEVLSYDEKTNVLRVSSKFRDNLKLAINKHLENL